MLAIASGLELLLAVYGLELRAGNQMIPVR